MKMRGTQLLRCAAALLVAPAIAAAQAWAAAGPVGVSPGERGSFSGMSGRCPTFSWTAVEGAAGYRLAVLGVDTHEAGDPRGARSAAAVLDVRLAAALSWTPSLDRCLGRGKRYAWSVRAFFDGDREGKWSIPLMFSIDPAKSATEVAQRLRRLEGARAGNGVRGEVLAGSPAVSPSVPPESPTGLTAPRNEPSDGGVRAPAPDYVSAIRSETDSDTLPSFALWGVALNNESGAAGVLGQATSDSGIVDGVRGETSSYDGVGVKGRSTRTDGDATGVEGHTAASQGYGGRFVHAGSGGTALYARAGNDDSADLVLGSNSPTANDGVLRSQPSDSGSDLRIESNDFLRLRLDRDGSSSSSFFALRNGGGGNVLYANEGGAVSLNGSLTVTSALTVNGAPGGNLATAAEIEAIADALIAAHEVGHP